MDGAVTELYSFPRSKLTVGLSTLHSLFDDPLTNWPLWLSIQLTEVLRSLE